MQCLPGSFGNDAMTCSLCPIGFYSDQKGASKCQTCTATGITDSSCKYLPGQSTQDEIFSTTLMDDLNKVVSSPTVPPAKETETLVVVKKPSNENNLVGAIP